MSKLTMVTFVRYDFTITVLKKGSLEDYVCSLHSSTSKATSTLLSVHDVDGDGIGYILDYRQSIKVCISQIHTQHCTVNGNNSVISNT